MWLWLRKRLPKSLALWSKLVAYVGGLHCIVLFMLFFVYQGDNQHLSFVINRSIDINAAVVFLPLQKRAGALNTAGNGVQAKSVESPKVKEPVKEPVSAALALTKKKSEKAATTITATQSKKKAEKKSKKLVAQKKDQTKPEKPVEPKPVIQTKPDETLSVASTSTAVAQSTENIQYLGRLDLQALEIQEAINSEVGQHWSPPPGIAKSAVCQAYVTVGWDGTVICTIEKSSGIAIYDVSARAAMRTVSFPKQLWGKSFSLTFKQ